jgi:prepilin-type N-terminal cleavage/methylation domain-containing protein
MKRLYNKKGMTLIEIIVALAILGMVSVIFLTMFGNSYSTIFKSGHRTVANMELQSIADELNLNSNIFVDDDDITDYMNIKGYNKVANVGNIATNVSGDVNYYMQSVETISNTAGYQVTILKLFNNGNDFVKVTTFIIPGGI